ncbi:MAG TPA: EAL domain-containing protein, partial [Allocoleopsis sp.]
GHYISANPALARIYGYDSPGELITHLTDISNQLYVQPNRRQEFISILQKQDIIADFESQVYRKDGEIIWIAENARAVHDEKGNLMYYEGTVEDITELKKNKEQLFYHAFYDNVTGLANRALFMDRLGNAVVRAKRNKNYLFAVLFLDLDRFKLVNDSLGHLVGDKLLIGIARRLEKCLRTVDTVARLGGDEFTIILDDIEDLKSAIYVAERINNELKRPFYIEGNEIFSGTSIGIVINGQKMGENYPLYEKPEDLLRDADTALYRAKNLGKSRYEVFDITMHEKAVEILKLETDLRHALERDELQIYYQPCLSLSEQKIIGFEALLRWEHPQKGLIMPEQFLSIAEETGLIVPIGYWMLEKVLHQLFIWKTTFSEQDFTMSVNLTDKQFMQGNLSLQIDKILGNYGLSGANLILEIGENCLMKNSSLALGIINELKQKNILICLDNFGQGYTSLNLLHQFPLNILKLDPSFFNGAWNGAQCAIDNYQYQSDNYAQIKQQNWDYEKQMTRGIVMLAENLGMQVIANNVETFNQLNLIKEINCQYAQGNLLFPPLNAQNATQLIMDSDRRIEN